MTLNDNVAPQTARTPRSGDTVLEVAQLSVDFPTDDGVVHAVRDVSFALARGEALGIVGESGSGKSVTSLAIMGLLGGNAEISGSARFDEQELIGASDKDLSGIRGRKISMIFQDPMTSLNPVYTVGHQIAEAVHAHHDVSKEQARERALRLLGIVGIPNPEARLRSYPHELSGGMRQRVVIAVAIANDPDVIIADEPTTALDVTVQAQVLGTLQAAKEETGAALILITHDLGVVAGQADRIAVMYAGRVVETGTADDVFYEPRMPYTLGLLGSIPRLDRSTKEPLAPIEGAPPSLINIPPGCPFTPRCPLASPSTCEHSEPELRPTTSMDHRAACHFSDQLEDMAPGDLFRATTVDAQALAAVARRSGHLS